MARKTDPGGESKAETSRWLPVIIELPAFSQKWGQYRLTEVDRTTMLEAILSDPEAWPVQRGTAGAQVSIRLSGAQHRPERRLSRFLRRVPEVREDCPGHPLSQECAGQSLAGRPESGRQIASRDRKGAGGDRTRRKGRDHQETEVIMAQKKKALDAASRHSVGTTSSRPVVAWRATHVGLRTRTRIDRGRSRDHRGTHWLPGRAS